MVQCLQRPLEQPSCTEAPDMSITSSAGLGAAVHESHGLGSRV